MRKALLLLLILALGVGAMSSAEAAGKIDDCIKADNSALMQTTHPISVAGGSYWVFYYPISSAKKLLILVDDETQAVSSDENIMAEAGNAVYTREILDAFIVSKGWSASSLSSAVDDSLSTIQEQAGLLESFKVSIESKYPTITLDDVQSKLSELTVNLEQLSYGLRDASDSQQFFENDLNAENAQAIVSQYNGVFDGLFLVIDSYNNYQTSISAVEAKAYRASIPATDLKSIMESLENMRLQKTAIAELKNRAKSADPRPQFAKLVNAEGAWVNDSISSFQFFSAKCAADKLYVDNLPAYRLIADNRQTIIDYGFGGQVEDINKKWAQIDYWRGRKSLTAYKNIIEAMPATAAAMSQLAVQYKQRIEPQATPKPPQKPLVDSTMIVIIVLVLALGAYYFYQKKKQEEFAS